MKRKARILLLALAIGLWWYFTKSGVDLMCEVPGQTEFKVSDKDSPLFSVQVKHTGGDDLPEGSFRLHVTVAGREMYDDKTGNLIPLKNGDSVRLSFPLSKDKLQNLPAGRYEYVAEVKPSFNIVDPERGNNIARGYVVLE